MKVAATLLALNLIAFGSTAPAWANPDPTELRLVKTSVDGEPVWMDILEIGALKNKAHKAGHCGGYMDVTDFPNDVHEPRSFSPAFDLDDFEDPVHGETVNPLLAQLSSAKLLATVDKLSSFTTRHAKSDTGVQSAEWIRSEFARIAGNRSDVTIEQVAHNGLKQPSIIVRIAGTGPKKAERVILGAHQDSINHEIFGGGVNARAPGADDDASGIATLLETFRVLIGSGFRPDRTIEFMAYSGEELGLLGSQAIAKSYKDGNIPVAAVLQFDMTFYPGDLRRITFMTDFTHAGLNRFLQKLVTTYARADFDTDRCGYGCSDHASWNKYGFASAMPFETRMNSHNPEIHTKKDTIADMRLDAEFGLGFAKLATAAAVELSAFPKN